MGKVIDHDWEYSESNCPKCYNQMAFRSCNECENADDDECGNCGGIGFEEWCRACGWDETFGRFMSPQYEQVFQDRQR